MKHIPFFSLLYSPLNSLTFTNILGTLFSWCQEHKTDIDSILGHLHVHAWQPRYTLVEPVEFPAVITKTILSTRSKIVSVILIKAANILITVKMYSEKLICAQSRTVLFLHASQQVLLFVLNPGLFNTRVSRQGFVTIWPKLFLY